MSAEIELESGKYKIVHQDEGEFRAYRNGLAWRELAGDKLILAMVYRIKGLQKNLEEANRRNRAAHRYQTNLTAAMQGLLTNPATLGAAPDVVATAAHEMSMAIEKKISEFDQNAG